MDFHWGQTPESDAFFGRHPKFEGALARFIVLANRTIEQGDQSINGLTRIGFNLGQTCLNDFLEITFLSAHGWGTGAQKILRGLYERAVALAYMIKNPDKAERFFKYGAIQEYKVMVPAVELAGEEAFDESMRGTTSVAQIKQFREAVKSEFQIPTCRECNQKGTCSHMTTANSWDRNGIQAQVKDLGKPYEQFYLGAYAIPNMHVHASLTSAMHEYGRNPDERTAGRRSEADFAMLTAHAVMLLVIRSQNDLFSLGLEREIEACEKDWEQVWNPAAN